MGRTNFEKARRVLSGLGLIAFVVVALLNDPVASPVKGSAMEICGFMMLIVAMLGRTWAGCYLSGRKSKVLTTVGPYSLSRNPLYLFSFVGAIGLGLLTMSVTLLAAISVLFLVYYHFVIRHEEQRLGELFGEAFEAYKRRVPRLFPKRLTPTEDVRELTIQPHSFMRSMRDTSVFLWVFVLFEIGEATQELFHWFHPTVFHLQ